MNIHEQKVCWDIINCGLTQFNHPSTCANVLTSQGAASKKDFHIPEPWNGDISSAKVLFVSINPGFTPHELYPRLGNPFWTSGPSFDTRKVEDFFEGRFDLVKPYVTYKTCGHAFKIMMEYNSPKSLRGFCFWRYVFGMANVLIPNADPLKDFAITELVHCKSKNVSFINSQCYKMCMDRHLNNIFSIASNVKYVVFIGSSVRKNVCDYYSFSSPIKQQWYTTTKLNGRNTDIIFVDHNNARPNSGKRACGIHPPHGPLLTI